MTRPSRVIIDKQALKHNFQLTKQFAPNSKIIAIIKANAYGHGLIRVAKTLTEADAFGVTCLEEAAQLREAKITSPIILLEGPYKETDLSRIVALDLDIVVHNQHQVNMLERGILEKKLQVWIKLDTGMHRLGVSLDLFKEMMERLKSCPNIKKKFV